MILNTLTVTPEIRDYSIRLAEEIFDIQNHQDQMRAEPATFDKLKALSPDSVLYEIADADRLAGWVVIVPTNKEIMDKFTSKVITEQQLLDMSKPSQSYSALYLCAAATLPEYRRMGIALRLTKEAISRMHLTSDYELFAWPTTKEGESVLKKLETETGKMIHIRQ
jgi:ribosomal protein S18 acetylase RimI-like enzyme